jgi:hypothetical protein
VDLLEPNQPVVGIGIISCLGAGGNGKDGMGGQTQRDESPRLAGDARKVHPRTKGFARNSGASTVQQPLLIKALRWAILGSNQ